MSHPSLSLSIAMAALVACTPVPAAPLHITVPGGADLPNPYPNRHYLYGFDNDRTSRDILWNESWTPDRLGGPFDGAREAADAEAIVHPKVRFEQQWNPAFAATIARTGDSFAGHWLKCQATYAGYDLVSDTHMGPGGIPQPCRL